MFSPRTISFSLVFAGPLRKLNRFKIVCLSVNRFRSTCGRSMAGNYRENSPVNVENLSGERNRSYRRSMKRKIEPRVSQEKRNFTIDRFERVALSLRLRGLWNPRRVSEFGERFRDRDRVKAGSDWIRIYSYISEYKYIWQYILFYRFDWLKLSRRSIIMPKIRDSDQCNIISADLAQILSIPFRNLSSMIPHNSTRVLVTSYTSKFKLNRFNYAREFRNFCNFHGITYTTAFF